MADLLVIVVKARRLGDQRIAEQLPALTEKQLKEVSTLGATEGNGLAWWGVAVLILPHVLPLGRASIALVLVVAPLVIALPGLGKWWRGIAALVTVAFPVAYTYPMILAAEAAAEEMPRLVAEAGARNAVRIHEGGEFVPLLLSTLVLVPIAGVRGWPAARRRSAGQPPLPGQRVAPGAVSHFTSQT
ncbi:hypothetical protein [Virgisporangium aliadipatigenens]|uniref:hypothetical protein n=1 Tax=Virgisporangium aliadipatigenens TaxID=741659 RepID=UPI001942416E|nr:hypothetical protein [Virgisporangium aliadipatigenens]